MSPMAQAKLLRVLQERELRRLGGTRPVKANVRVIAASNAPTRWFTHIVSMRSCSDVRGHRVFFATGRKYFATPLDRVSGFTSLRLALTLRAAPSRVGLPST